MRADTTAMWWTCWIAKAVVVTAVLAPADVQVVLLDQIRKLIVMALIAYGRPRGSNRCC
ncbi:hypothetical protein JL101_025315 [Skermanella rosea]|uniref:hypothetical protein n=1 Tax=Skermanella rosea TaxID=1817965 RepID=UPI0019332ABA|nr:hypothetical protein [Skermanella rosea]UEM03250.1 hypothetical protein JL101_025315 [Skermanella rosea]